MGLAEGTAEADGHHLCGGGLGLERTGSGSGNIMGRLDRRGGCSAGAGNGLCADSLGGYQFFAGGIVMMIIGAVMGGNVVVDSGAAFAVLTYLAFLSAVAYSLWGVLLKYNPVSKVTIYSFTIPVFGVLLSNLMLTEQSNVEPLNLVLTLILICSGIIILNYKKD